MSEESARMIKQHEELEPHESDASARENAAARLWATGDPDSMNAAEAIWEELQTKPSTIQALKDFMLKLKNAK